MHEIDWARVEFDIEKAYCMALLSELAYLNITDEEYDHPYRAELVPCEYHAAAVRHGYRIDFAGEAGLRRAEGLQLIDIIVTKYFVALVLKCYERLIVLSVRGTQFAYDWKLNLDARKDTSQEFIFHTSQELIFHRGFLTEALKLLYHIERAPYAAMFEGRTPVYFTGHSLGGAVAAICFGICKHSYDIPQRRWAYTFATPRYSILKTLMRIRTPYHIRRLGDIVPSVSPRLLGYYDIRPEFDLNGNVVAESTGVDFTLFSKWILMLWGWRSLMREHSMELYRKTIGDNLPRQQRDREALVQFVQRSASISANAGQRLSAEKVFKSASKRRDEKDWRVEDDTMREVIAAAGYKGLETSEPTGVSAASRQYLDWRTIARSVRRALRFHYRRQLQ
jgi:hypothetical protein